MLVKNGQTDVTTYYFALRDSTNHAPKTDVTVTDIDLYYVGTKVRCRPALARVLATVRLLEIKAEASSDAGKERTS